MPSQSAIPGFYYAVFAFYEPGLCLMGGLGAFLDPKSVRLLFPILQFTF